jgi:hypothetical protein
VKIQNIDGYLDKHDQPVVRMVVHFSCFEDARRVFESLFPERVTIEDFRRAESFQKLPGPGVEKTPL